MPVAIESALVAETQLVGTSLSIAVNAGTAGDRWLLVLSRAFDIPTVTYAGAAMASASTPNINIRRFTLAAPSQGSNNLVVTFADPDQVVALVILALSGVHQTNPIAQTVSSTNGFSPRTSGSATLPAGGLIVGGALGGTNNTWAANNADTVILASTGSSNSGFSPCAVRRNSTGQLSLTNSGFSSFGIVGYAINQAVVATFAPPTVRRPRIHNLFRL